MAILRTMLAALALVIALPASADVYEGSVTWIMPAIVGGNNYVYFKLSTNNPSCPYARLYISDGQSELGKNRFALLMASLMTSRPVKVQAPYCSYGNDMIVNTLELKAE